MRQRGISTLGGILLAALAGVLTATVLMDWMVVDVRVADPDPLHVKVPFPLVAGRIAASFIPDDVTAKARIPDQVRESREQILDAVRALLDAPDASLVKVSAPDALVDISKRGNDVIVAVDADDARVHCTVPLDGILDALEDWDWQTVDVGMVFDILDAVEGGDLVRVEVDDGTRVAITMW